MTHEEVARRSARHLSADPVEVDPGEAAERADPHATVVVHGHVVERPHPESEHDAGTGQGTIRGWTHGRTQEHPILDGSTQNPAVEHDVENPWRGLDDPGLTRHPWRIPESERHQTGRAA